MRTELFRQEVITNRRQSLLGEIFLAQPFPFRVITLIIAVLFSLTLSFLWLTPTKPLKPFLANWSRVTQACRPSW